MTKPEIVEVPVPYPVPIAEELTAPIDEPRRSVEVWADVALLAVDYRARFHRCEAQKAAIREAGNDQ